MQEAFDSPTQPSKLRRIALDFHSPQQSPLRGNSSPSNNRRGGTPSVAGNSSTSHEARLSNGPSLANGGGSPGLGQSLRSPSGAYKRSSLLAAISSSIRYTVNHLLESASRNTCPALPILVVLGTVFPGSVADVTTCS